MARAARGLRGEARVIQRLGEVFNRLAQRLMPDPFVFALLLTLATFAIGVAWAGASPMSLVRHWQEGFFTPALLVFTLQMCLVLLTGHALASARPVAAALARLASLPRGPASAAALTAFVASAAALLNWGLGLIVGALLAREVARSARARGVAIHYPLVVAAGYTGLLIWHGGLSGSAPVGVATAGHFLEKEIGVIPVSRTLLSPLNIVVCAALLAASPALLALMAPRGDGAGGAGADTGAGAGEGCETARTSGDAVAGPEGVRGAGDAAAPATLVERLERSRALALAAGALGAAFLVPHFAGRGLGGLDLNTIILTFLLTGLLLHGSPRRYAAAIDEATPSASGILLQFPFYFGIMGMMKGAGLIALLAGTFVRICESLARVGVPVDASYSVTTFASACIVALFIPSGGSQWAVQGPIAVEAAQRLGVPISKAVMAVAYGDEYSNMLQPFWALPLLAITGLKAREVIGYTALLMLLVTPIYVVALAFLR
jgi:short-chain fatty acids transporter